MAEQVKKYHIIFDSRPGALEVLVNKELEAGATLVGGVSVAGDDVARVFAQAVMR